MSAKYVAVSKAFGRLPGSWDTESEAWEAIKGAVNPMWHDMPGHWEAPTVQYTDEPMELTTFHRASGYKDHQHVWPERTVDDMATEFTCSACGELVAYW